MNGSNKLGERAFLYIVSAALADLGMRNSPELDNVLSDLKFHTHNLMYLIPETETKQESISQAEGLYATLIEYRESMSAKYASMTAEEWHEGTLRRQVRSDLFDPLN